MQTTKTLVKCDIYDHAVTYFITGKGDDMTADIDILNIDSYDDPQKAKISSFVVLIKGMCQQLKDKNVKKVSMLASKKEYNDTKELYGKFKVKVINDNVVELTASPETFPEAMLKCWGFPVD